MKNFYVLATAVALSSTPALADTIDFTSIAPGTVVSNQFAGLTFSLLGGPQPGSPTVGYAFGGNNPQTLNNSITDNYPTGTLIDIVFAGGASGVSFTFSNFGDNAFAPSNWTAFAANNSVISSGNINTVEGLGLVSVLGSDIAKLQISNGSDGTYDWLFGIGELNYTLSAVPEPSTWALMILGFGLIGGAMRRRQAPAVRFAF